MATLDAARALGLDQRIGSLEKGKHADIAAIRLAGPELSPCYDPLSHLAYVVGREHVSHVWIDGDLLVRDGALTHMDDNELVAKATYWQGKISSQNSG
jgi:5-methylthioadenosine/S-adenosylhomocysteine deaminase